MCRNVALRARRPYPVVVVDKIMLGAWPKMPTSANHEADFVPAKVFRSRSMNTLPGPFIGVSVQKTIHCMNCDFLRNVSGVSGTYFCSRSRPTRSSRLFNFNSIQFSLFPAHINISYSNNNVYILCRKRGEQKTMLMDVRPLTITSKLRV